MKYLLYLHIASMVSLVGCTKWALQNQESIENTNALASGMGPYGAIIGLVGSTALGFSKWWEHKKSAKEVILSTQEAKNSLPEESKKILKEAYKAVTPSKVRNYVAKVKSKF